LVVTNAEIGDENGSGNGRLLHRFSPGVYRGIPFELTWLVEGFVQAFSANFVNDFPIDHRLPTAPAPRTSAPLVVTHAHDSWIAYLANVIGEIRILADDLALYRRHRGSLTSRRVFSMGEKIATSLTNHGERYRDLGQWYETAANVAEELQKFVDGQPRVALLRASKKARDEATFLLDRANFWLESKPNKRLPLYLRMVVTGAYWRSENSSRLAILKDTVGLFAGSQFRP
jgi:hypothetical protein